MRQRERDVVRHEHARRAPQLAAHAVAEEVFGDVRVDRRERVVEQVDVRARVPGASECAARRGVSRRGRPRPMTRVTSHRRAGGGRKRARTPRAQARRAPAGRRSASHPVRGGGREQPEWRREGGGPCSAAQRAWPSVGGWTTNACSACQASSQTTRDAGRSFRAQCAISYGRPREPPACAGRWRGTGEGLRASALDCRRRPSGRGKGPTSSAHTCFHFAFRRCVSLRGCVLEHTATSNLDAINLPCIRDCTLLQYIRLYISMRDVCGVTRSRYVACPRVDRRTIVSIASLSIQ